MSKKVWCAIAVLILLGCQQDKTEWNPIFEETHFNYFAARIDRSLSLLDDAHSQFDGINPDAVKTDLEKTRNELLAIKDYYIPLTTVRQKIYDADRFFKLKRIKETASLLNDSKAIITGLDATTRNKVFDRVIVQLHEMIDEVITSLDDGSTQDTYDKMKILGEHVNMMLNRGDLVLSGIEFDK